MGRPKGSGKKAEKPVQDEQPAVHGTEPDEQAPEVKEPDKAPKTAVVAAFNTCRYHDTQAPRVFKAGEVIPEGWQEGRVFEWGHWTFDADGKWIRKEK